MTETSAILRSRAAQVVRLAHTISNDSGRAALLDYAQWLLTKARQVEQQAEAMPTTVFVVDPKKPGTSKPE
jgi:hypothetical protein